MSHTCGRSSSDKHRILNAFNKQFKTTDKNCCSVNRSTADSKCSNHHSKADEQHRPKRLRSRKERSKMRGFGKEAPKSQSHHHRCRCQSSKDITYVHDSCRHSSCHSSCRCASRQEALFLNVVPTAQEPSIITDSRLIGHHGLFNHEVKSIDIDRLLSKQKKMEKNGQQDHENNAISRPSSTSHIPSPISSNDILGTEPDEVVILEKEGEPAVKAHVDCQEKEDETPKQKTNTVMSEKPTETLLTPADNGDNMMTLNKKEMTSTLKQTPKNSDGVSQSTFQLPSSRTAESSDSRHQRPDPSSLSESVQSVAASLCGRQLFPLLRRRDLVKESREVLLKALKERHGPWLQENLFRLRQYPSSGFDHSKEVQDQEPTMRDEDEFQRTDAFTTEFQASNPFSVSPQRKYSKRKRSAYLNLRFNPQQLQKPEQPAEWLRQPVETSTGLLDNFLKSPHSPQFSMDFEPSGIRDHLFAPSSTSCWEEKNSAFPHWGDTLSRQKSEEASTFNSFGNSFVNQTRARDALQYSLSTAQSVPPYYTQLPDRYSTEPVHFPQEQDPFRAERHSFPSQLQHPEQGHSLLPFSQAREPSACPPLRPHQRDMIYYPPSHMLERDTAPSRSLLLSPEHWSFPPMRLY